MVKEGDPRNISSVIDALNAGERPLDQFLGRCLAEMYQSGQYGTSIIYGTRNPNEDMFISYLRVVALRLGEIQSIVLTFEHNRGAQRRIIDKLLQLTRDLPLDRNSMRPIAEIATRSVEQAGILTLAAMQVSNSIATGAEIVQVSYPKTYMHLLPVPEDYQRDLAFGMAIHYLKNVPFGRGNITIQVPSN